MADKKKTTQEDGAANRAKAHTSRRVFLKKAVFSTVAVAATATLAKKTGDVLLKDKEDLQKLYLNDVLPGDNVLARRQYVLMTKEEKEALVKGLAQSKA